MHCGEAQGDTMEACVHRMLYCSAVQSSVDEFRSQDFGLKLNWEAPMGSDLVYSILSQNGTLIRPASTRFVIGLQSHACSAESICAGRSLWRLDLVARDSSHNILTLDALQVLSRSQVTPGLSMSMRIRPICNLHTYIHPENYRRSGYVRYGGQITHVDASYPPRVPGDESWE
jgi:hypothetical protein